MLKASPQDRVYREINDGRRGSSFCCNTDKASSRRQVISQLMRNVKMSIACRACRRLLASIAPSCKPAIERRELLFHPESGKIAADSLVIQNSQGLVVYFFPIPQQQVG